MLAVWAVLGSGIYGAVGAGEENLVVATLAFRSALISWYKARHAQNPGENLTRVFDFTKKMIGTEAKPHLKTKGAETFGLMKFLIHTFQVYGCRLGEHWQRLLQAGQALDRIIEIWNSSGWVMTPAAREDFTNKTEWPAICNLVQFVWHLAI